MIAQTVNAILKDGKVTDRELLIFAVVVAIALSARK